MHRDMRTIMTQLYSERISFTHPSNPIEIIDSEGSQNRKLKWRRKFISSNAIYAKWAKNLLVPDTSVAYFVMQSLNQSSYDTKQCLPVKTYIWARFYPTKCF